MEFLGIGAAGLFSYVLLLALVGYALYWVVRLGVRAGVADAWKRRDESRDREAMLRSHDGASARDELLGREQKGGGQR
jgi:hypothetical protein